jgi:hypothetical protein
MKFIPDSIKYADMHKNKPIKNNTDTIGFLLIITNIPHKKDIREIKVKN